jgi:hypothetical protein
MSSFPPLAGPYSTIGSTVQFPSPSTNFQLHQMICVGTWQNTCGTLEDFLAMASPTTAQASSWKFFKLCLQQCGLVRLLSRQTFIATRNASQFERSSKYQGGNLVEGSTTACTTVSIIASTAKRQLPEPTSTTMVTRKKYRRYDPSITALRMGCKEHSREELQPAWNEIARETTARTPHTPALRGLTFIASCYYFCCCLRMRLTFRSHLP